MSVFDYIPYTDDCTIDLHFKLETMLDYPIQVLRDTEAVLMKRIGRMRDGKPRTAAQDRLNCLRDAIRLLTKTTADRQQD